VQYVVGSADEIFIPVIVVGELYFGAENSSRQADNIARVDEFITRYTILDCDVQTARFYGQIESQLRAKGKPIPPNDMWIAAIARQHNLTVLPQDAHFNHVDGLPVQGW
jgi:tRNA(fMet)-specific endonuclease VapC